MPSRPRLLLLLGTGSQWERDVSTGFARRARGVAEVDLLGLNRRMVRPPSGTAGVLVAELDPARLAVMQAWGLPLVGVGLAPESPVAQVTVDDAAVGRLAAGHLLGLGWRELALVGDLRLPYWRSRCAAAAATAAAAGASVHRWQGAPPDWTALADPRCVAWLASLPHPLGVVAANDCVALAVLRACRQAGLVVGLDVAVVGADDEAALAGVCDPPLSTVDVAGTAVGAAAADLLLALVRGQPPPLQPLLVPPAGVVVRASSGGPAVSDPALARALRLAIERPGLPWTAADLVRASGLPRRTAEQRFRRILGLPPGAWLLQRRLEQARRLLATSDQPVAVVARQCGFSDPAYFSRLFSRAAGCPPLAWRRRAARGAP